MLSITSPSLTYQIRVILNPTCLQISSPALLQFGGDLVIIQSPYTWLKSRPAWLSPYPTWHLPIGPPSDSRPLSRSDHVTGIINGRRLSATWHSAPAVSGPVGRMILALVRCQSWVWPIRHCQRQSGDEWTGEAWQRKRREIHTHPRLARPSVRRPCASWGLRGSC